MLCTGKEERLRDCDFPENFGEAPDAPSESSGIGAAAVCSDPDDLSNIASVACRHFPIPGLPPALAVQCSNVFFVGITCMWLIVSRR